MEFEIGTNGLTLEEVENHIIDIYHGKELADNPDKDTVFRAYKEARMKYLDALNIDEEWLFTEEYEKKRRKFERRTQDVAHRNFMEDFELNACKPEPERETKFEATEYWRFPASNERTDQLRMALMEGKVIVLKSEHIPNYESSNLLAGHPTYRYGIAYSHEHGYDARFLELKKERCFADSDIVELVNINVEQDYGRYDVPVSHAEQRTLLQCVEGSIKDLFKDRYVKDEQEEDLNLLLSWRRAILNKMFRDEPEEISALQQTNEALSNLEHQMAEKCMKLWSVIKNNYPMEPDSDFSTYRISGKIGVIENNWPDDTFYDIHSCKHHPFDDYYGCDFPNVLPIIEQTSPKPCEVFAGLDVSVDDARKELTPTVEEYQEDYFSTFTERPDVEAKIKPCRTFLGLLGYYSLADIPHLNRFCIKTDFTTNHITDQTGNTEYESYQPGLIEYLAEAERLEQEEKEQGHS